VHPLRVGLDECLGGSVVVVGDEDGGFVVAEPGDGELADGAGVGGQPGGGVFVDLDSAGLAAGAGHGQGGPGLGREGVEGGGEFGGSGAPGEEADAAVVEFGQLGLGGDFGVEDQQPRVTPGGRVPVVGEGEHLACLGGLGQVGVGIQQGVGVGVFCEEGEHAAGALGTPWYVVFFQRRVLAPVH